MMMAWETQVKSTQQYEVEIQINPSNTYEEKIAEILKEVDESEENERDMNEHNNHLSDFLVEKNARRYFVGYIVLKVILRRINCTHCANIMNKKEEAPTSSSEHLIHNKDYSGLTSNDQLYLKSPSDEFFNICELHFNIYRQMFRDNIKLQNIRK